MKYSGGEIIVEYLVKEGVPYIIGIPGHGILGLFDAIKDADKSGKIKYIQVKHEQAAMHIADGYYRITGKPLAVIASIGPGSLNTMIGVGTSFVDSTAVLVMIGDTHINMKGAGVLQEFERHQDSAIIRAFEPVSKRAWRVENVCQLPRIMQRAFNQMLAGRNGPVVLSLPMDVQADVLDIEIENSLTRRPVSLPGGQTEYIEQAVEIMKHAKRPVILLGGAALRSHVHSGLVKLAELWGAAVVTTMAGKSAFPEDHPLYGWHTGSKGTTIGLELTRNADVILALGTRFADETTCSYRDGASFSFGATKLIHADIDPVEIGKNYPCEVGIVGDLNIIVGQLLDVMSSSKCFDEPYMSKPYTQEIARLQKEWRDYVFSKRSIKTEKITISQLIGVLNDNLPADTIICTSSGNTQAQMFQEYCFRETKTHLTTGGFSTMGFAVPAAIGAKLAKPEVPVVAVLGDGDFMMVMQELATIAQYNVPIIIVIANNCGWMAIKDLQTDVFGEEHTFGNDWMQDGSLYSPDFKSIAKAFGIDAVKLSQSEDLAKEITEAVKRVKPLLIEVDVVREYPESGGKAFGWWDVPIPPNYPEKRQSYLENKKAEKI